MPTDEGVSLTPSSPAAPAAPVATSAPAEVPGNVAPAAPVAPSLEVGLSPPAPVAPGDASDPWSTLSAENKALVTAKGWKTHDDIVKSAIEAEKKLSSTRPADLPKDVAAYEASIVAPANAEEIGYSDDFAKFFRGASFESKVPVEAAKALHDSLVTWAAQNTAAVAEARTNAIKESVANAATELTKAWGETNNSTFTRNLDMSMRAIRNLDPDLRQALVDTGAIVSVDGKEKVANPVILRALAKVGSTMFAEDSLFGDPAANGNPFDPDTLDVTAQGKIYSKDKQQAKSLIMALPQDKQARYASLLARIG